MATIRQLLRGRPEGMKPGQLARHALSIKFAPDGIAQSLLLDLLDGNESFYFEDGRWHLADSQFTSLDLVPFVVVDVETTGGRAARDRLIEIGAFKVVGGRVADSIMALINPGRHIPLHISHLTGIYDEHVLHSPKAEDILPRFVNFLADSVFVGHNARFDYRFVNSELQRAGLPRLDNELVCTIKLARRIFPGEPSYGLDHLIKKFNFPLDPLERHRGHGDSWATAELLIRCLDRLNSAGILSLEELLALQAMKPPKARRLIEKSGA